MHSAGFLAAFFALAFAILAFFPVPAFAYQTVEMQSMQSYDITNYTTATWLKCTSGGIYYISGHNNTTMLDISVPAGQLAEFVFSDTQMTPAGPAPGSTSGSKSAITIEETGGTVVLRSQAGATAEFVSQGTAPAIKKNGKTTKLIFSTVDPDNPGTIIARADPSGQQSAGIGSENSARSRNKPAVGNIMFNSGNIEAYGSHGSNSFYSFWHFGQGGPGIGASYGSSVDGLTFVNANVKAVAGDESSAAIGTASAKEVFLPAPQYADNITIQGGKIQATHWRDPNGSQDSWALLEEGAGIGGGYLGSVRNLTISGGTVEASGFTGIGGGGDGNAMNIDISGGYVTANGSDTGIGGGITTDGIEVNFNPDLPDVGETPSVGSENYIAGDAQVKISGGTVIARAGTYFGNEDGVGIGSWHTTSKPGGWVQITGGNVTAAGSGAGAGIGCGFYGSLNYINISGGTVSATGGSKGFGIGHMQLVNSGVYSNPVDSIIKSMTISGGTISVTGGSEVDGDIGSYAAVSLTSHSPTPVCISGGNVKTAHGANGVGDGATPYSAGKGAVPVYLNKVSLEKFGCTLQNPEDPVSSFSVAQGSGSYQYGINDMHTFNDDTALWVWLPETATATDVSLAKPYYWTNVPYSTFSGITTAKQGGTLYPSIAAKLLVSADPVPAGSTAGSASMRQGYAAAKDMKNAVWPGHTLKGYSTDAAGATMVLNADGTLKANVDGTTDASARFIGSTKSAFDNDLRLYAQWQPTTYRVAFNANKPGNASHAVAGTMASQSFTYGTAQALTANGYSLPGWTFTGWNTKADGTGTAYANGASVQDLTSTDGATVTLFAQWTPRIYTVTFVPDGGTGTMALQFLKYDTPEALEANSYTFTGYVFAGWLGNALGSLFTDGETVVNLSGLDESGQPSGATLSAAWASTELQALITITNDDQPLSGLDSVISLRSGGTMFAVGQFAEVAPGTGTYELPADPVLPDGTYDVLITGYDTAGVTLTIAAGTTATVDVDYCTVDITAEDHATAWIEPGGAHVTEVTNVLEGSTLDINASVDTGYAFESYTASGYAPTWKEGDPMKQVQTITVNGQTTIEAHPTSAHYQVAFAPNGGSGTMTNQDMVYDEPQNLFLNTFSRVGYTFAGWTTTPEWAGGTKVNSTGESSMSPQAAAFYTDGQSVSNLTAEGGKTVTLYAQWTPHAYFIDFQPNGATGEMLDQKIFYDSATKLDELDFEMADWHFTGWNTVANPTAANPGTSYADQAEVKNLSAENDASIMLFAQWQHDTFTLTLYPNGAAGQPESTVIWTNAGYNLPVCGFPYTGHTCTGWNTQPGGDGTPYAQGAIVNAPPNAAEGTTGLTMNLYAQWRVNTYAVSFDANAPSGAGDATGTMPDQAFSYGTAQALTTNAYELYGYEFKGWNTAADGSGTPYADAASVLDLTADDGATVALYAQWSKLPDVTPVQPSGDESSGTAETGDSALPLAGLAMLCAASGFVMAVARRRSAQLR